MASASIWRAWLVAVAILLSGCAGHACTFAGRSLNLTREQAIGIADRFLLDHGQPLTAEQASKTLATELERGGGWWVHYHLTDLELPAGPSVLVSNCDGRAEFDEMNY